MTHSHVPPISLHSRFWRTTLIVISLMCLNIALGSAITHRVLAASPSTTVPLSAYVNNVGIGASAGQANFDGNGYSYPSSQMPTGGTVTLGGVPYMFPIVAAGTKDNVAAIGQTITLPQGAYTTASFLVASSFGQTSGTVTVTYTDGSTTTASLTVPDWYNSASSSVYTSSFRYSSTGTDQHAVYLFAMTISLNSAKTVSTLKLPTTALPANQIGSMHVFALTLLPSTPTGTPTTPTPTSMPGASQPCDIYAVGGTPCVAAHSTVRALYSSYTGSLYQVKRSSDNTTRDIGVLSTGGNANAAAQDAFCAGTTCAITIIYDQSGHGNHLAFQGPGGAGGYDTAANATSESLTVGGNKVYSLYINPGNSYWRNGSTTGIPTGSAPEGMYMVTSGTHVNSGCCFDYGNSETSRTAVGAGHMDAINFSTSCWFGGCSGSGPWVQADLEWGLFPGGSSSWNPNQRAFTNKYVTAMLKNNGTTALALKGGNAQSGTLTTLWNGGLPNGYNPMHKEGAIVLGSGGDCCAAGSNLSLGTFYEGAMVSGYPSDTTDNAIQANIVAAGYK
jgi:Alpha-L-arabinofuranosidase B, catalytic